MLIHMIISTLQKPLDFDFFVINKKLSDINSNKNRIRTKLPRRLIKSTQEYNNAA